jgi:hypothetical protein
MDHTLGYEYEMKRMASRIGEVLGGETLAFYPIGHDGSLAAGPLQSIFDGLGILYKRKDIEVDKHEETDAKAKLVTPVDDLIIPGGAKLFLVFDEPVMEGDTIMSGYVGLVANRDRLGIENIAVASITDRSGVTDICCDPLYITAHEKGRANKEDFIFRKWPAIYYQIREDLEYFENSKNNIPIIDVEENRIIQRRRQNHLIVRKFMGNHDLIIIGADNRGSIEGSGIHYRFAGVENLTNVFYHTLTGKTCNKLLEELVRDHKQDGLKVVIFGSDDKQIGHLLRATEKVKKRCECGFDCIGLYNNDKSEVFYIDDDKKLKIETFEKFLDKINLEEETVYV